MAWLRVCCLAATLARAVADEYLPPLGVTSSSTWRPDGAPSLDSGFHHEWDNGADDAFVYNSVCTAELAIDGNRDSYCCSTAEASPWLSVQLEPSLVSEVWVYHRQSSSTEDFSGLLEPFEVFVVDTPRGGGRTETFCGQARTHYIHLLCVNSAEDFVRPTPLLIPLWPLLARRHLSSACTKAFAYRAAAFPAVTLCYASQGTPAA